MDLLIQHLLEIIPGMTMATKDMVPGDRQSMKVSTEDWLRADGWNVSMIDANE